MSFIKSESHNMGEGALISSSNSNANLTVCFINGASNSKRVVSCLGGGERLPLSLAEYLSNL